MNYLAEYILDFVADSPQTHQTAQTLHQIIVSEIERAQKDDPTVATIGTDLNWDYINLVMDNVSYGKFKLSEAQCSELIQAVTTALEIERAIF